MDEPGVRNRLYDRLSEATWNNFWALAITLASCNAELDRVQMHVPETDSIAQRLISIKRDQLRL